MIVGESWHLRLFSFKIVTLDYQISVECSEFIFIWGLNLTSRYTYYALFCSNSLSADQLRRTQFIWSNTKITSFVFICHLVVCPWFWNFDSCSSFKNNVTFQVENYNSCRFKDTLMSWFLLEYSQLKYLVIRNIDRRMQQ